MPEKWMWIIAGPNGAGKSSVATVILAKHRIPTLTKLNADEVNAELRKLYPHLPTDRLNLRAAQLIDSVVADCIEEGLNFTVETVLSTDKYRKAVTDAKAKGFKFGLIYVSLWPPDLSPDRIKIRVAKGGHAVERTKAIERYHRSHKQLTWFAAQADRMVVLDNSSGYNEPAVIIAVKHLRKPIAVLTPNHNPSVDAALAPLLTPDTTQQLSSKRPSRLPTRKPKKDTEPS
jgi:predicted ABC-type ATPase